MLRFNNSVRAVSYCALRGSIRSGLFRTCIDIALQDVRNARQLSVLGSYAALANYNYRFLLVFVRTSSAYSAAI
jgi:hypothetical protein